MRYSVLFQILVVGLWLICELENTTGGRLLFASAPEASSAAALSQCTLVNDPVSASNLSAGSGNSTDKHGDFSINRAVFLTIVVVPVFAGLVMVCSVCFWFMRRSHASARSRNKTSKQRPDSGTCDSYTVIPLMPFLNNLNSRAAKKKGCVTVIEYSVLQEATNNFSSGSILGEGGFGRVYRAKFDNDNFAAVKKLDEDSKHAENEFENEMELMSKTRHPNLVSLLGYCNHENSRFLVYELMQNGSLEDQLHGPSHGSALTWSLRMKIALDSARGLEHLHEHCNPAVIHRDFKSSNILLDASFNAKLADFGLAVKVAGFGVSKDAELLGTLGYVAPEYLLDGKLTEKSDVYAFGVVLLELLFGRKPVDKTLSTECQSLVSWAMPKLTDRARLPSIIDPMIKDTMNVKHLYQLAAIAVLCIQPEPSYRPLIADVVHSLVPLVPAELGGTFRCPSSVSSLSDKSLPASYCSSKAA